MYVGLILQRYNVLRAIFYSLFFFTFLHSMKMLISIKKILLFHLRFYISQVVANTQFALTINYNYVYFRKRRTNSCQ